MDALNPRYPSKLSAGDRVAVLSPSSAGPALFPAPYELGLRRLRERFELEPVEYPTTRMLGASPRTAPRTSTPRSTTPPSRRCSPASAATTS